MLVDDLGPRLVGLEATDRPVIVGCSGGTDSLALLTLAAHVGSEPTAVHVDHGLRAGSDAESAVVADHAASLGVGFVAETVRVEPGPNVEARARAARYGALEQVRQTRGAVATLVGHTADDQAETVLLNLLRGGATAGLGAMAPRNGTLIRPLLALRRADTEAVCAELGLVPVQDPSNEDLTRRRNWIRHEVLPLLSKGAQRDVVALLARQADLFRSESEFLDHLASGAVAANGTAATDALRSLDPVLARRAVRQWLGPPPPSLAEVERVLAVAAGEYRATEVSGGRRVVRRHGRLHVERGTVTP